MPFPTITVSDEQVAFFHANGFLSIDRITTDEEIERIRSTYDEMFARRAGREEGMEFDLAGTDEEDVVATLPQILDPLRYAPALKNTLYEANALAVSKRLLGPEAVFQGSHAILKPAHYGSETPWHQDEAYWSPDFDYNALGVWMPLQDATIENGCMQFIPGSHRLDILPHHHVGYNPKIHALEVDDGAADLSGAVACPLFPAGATFHFSRTLHYAGPNRTETPRRAFIFGFGTPPRRRKTSRDLYWQRETTTYAAQKRATVSARQQAQKT
ncbi:MAG: phytanoyl-CoA dioxygenase family protein [candidate division Zixibacteria bacterium]|nr:phytanoyl-CoA dioxygenase family protein [candidate division Zixibacteria bacterium]